MIVVTTRSGFQKTYEGQIYISFVDWNGTPVVYINAHFLSEPAWRATFFDAFYISDLESIHGQTGHSREANQISEQ